MSGVHKDLHDEPGSGHHSEGDHIVDECFLFCCTFHVDHLGTVSFLPRIPVKKDDDQIFSG